MKGKIDLKNNSITFLINSKIYPKNAIYKATYVLIDRMYILLNISNKKDEYKVILRGKKKLKKIELENIQGDFFNELLNALVRENVSKRNQKVLEQIVGGAMGASLGMNGLSENVDAKLKENDKSKKDLENESEIEDAVATLKKELELMEVEEDYENDSMGIMKIKENTTKKSKKNNKKNEKK